LFNFDYLFQYFSWELNPPKAEEDDKEMSSSPDDFIFKIKPC